MPSCAGDGAGAVEQRRLVLLEDRARRPRTRRRAGRRRGLRGRCGRTCRPAWPSPPPGRRPAARRCRAPAAHGEGEGELARPGRAPPRASPGPSGGAEGQPGAAEEERRHQHAAEDRQRRAGPCAASRPRSQTALATGANQATRKVRPQMPVSETSCTSGSTPVLAVGRRGDGAVGADEREPQPGGRDGRREHERGRQPAQAGRQQPVGDVGQRVGQPEGGAEDEEHRPLDDVAAGDGHGRRAHERDHRAGRARRAGCGRSGAGGPAPARRRRAARSAGR